MSSFKFWVWAFVLASSSCVYAQGIGRAATANEIKAWDIDVRPDFKGLPKGAGSVSLGEQVWEGKCASCHGTFGESNSVFFQLVGFTDKKDVDRGNVATLQLGHDAPARTMSMKLSTLSTLWDYINRAMPWTAPKSLTADEVYGVTAYLLNLSNVLPDDFVLSNENIKQVQAMLPNRHGMTAKHAMWPGQELGGIDGMKAKPDTQGSTCIQNCKINVKVSSFIPAYAMTAHGNLAEQNRTWTSIVGLDTSKPMEEAISMPLRDVQQTPVEQDSKTRANKPSSTIKTADVMPLLQKHTCTACHAVSAKVMGPAFKDVAKKYVNRTDAVAYLIGKIKNGGSGVWGAIPMPPMMVSDEESRKIAEWLLQGNF